MEFHPYRTGHQNDSIFNYCHPLVEGFQNGCDRIYALPHDQHPGVSQAAAENLCKNNCNQPGQTCDSIAKSYPTICACRGSPKPSPPPKPTPKPSPPPKPTPKPSPTPTSTSGSWTGVDASVGWSSEPEYSRKKLGCNWTNPGNMCYNWPSGAPRKKNACKRNRYFGHGIGGANMKCGDCAKVRVKKTDGGYNQLCQLCVDNPDGASNEIGSDARAILMQANAEDWHGNKGKRHQTADRLGFEYQLTDCNNC